MLYIVKFGRRLHSATQETVMAAEAGNVSEALLRAPAMSQACAQLAMEAFQKAQGSFVRGNDEVYLQLAQQAHAFSEAGKTIADAQNADGTFNQFSYETGVQQLRYAIALLG